MICWQMRSDRLENNPGQAGGRRGAARSVNRPEWKERIFRLLFAGMAVYYGWRLFALTPWYDELYTYYCFISKGPVYAAVHWPLPNNHVGYSVLSGFLDFLGNPWLGLRGVSYLAALANLALLYKIAGRYLDGWLDLMAVILYASMGLVNQQAVQGRGYTLGITCFLLAWYAMSLICEQERVPRRIYVLYETALVLGLYTISSNVYWVVPLCLAGGSDLLLKGIREGAGQPGEAGRQESGQAQGGGFWQRKSIKRLISLAAASLAAAAGTVLLYATIWTAIGSNLLVKDETSAFYGMGHIKMILSAPFSAIGRGIEYMLATPYIQSEERAGFAGRLWEWLQVLSGSFYSLPGILILTVLGAGAVFLICKLIRGRKMGEDPGRLPEMILAAELLFVPAVLLIQCKRPYYRVFTYGGVLLSLLICFLLQEAGKAMKRRLSEKSVIRRAAAPAVIFLTALLVVKCFFFSGYQEQYGTREHEIAQAFGQARMDQWENLCVTDCNQEYLLYFRYGIRCENREIEGTDAVLLDKRMMDPDFDEMVWEFYHYYDSIPWDYVREHMNRTYENNDYVLFTRR